MSSSLFMVLGGRQNYSYPFYRRSQSKDTKHKDVKILFKVTQLIIIVEPEFPSRSFGSRVYALNHYRMESFNLC